MDSTFGILYVDDEERSLRTFERFFRSHFPVFIASNVQEGIALLEAHRHEIAILLTDQRMPDESGVVLLERAYEFAPEIVRILVTAYADTASAIDAVNRGKVAYFIEKPWDVDELTHVLKESVEMFEAKMVQQQLLEDQLDGLRESYQSDQISGFRMLAEGMSHNLSSAMTAIRCFLDALPAKLGDLDLDPRRMGDPAYWMSLHKDAQSNSQVVSQLGRALHEAANVEPFACEDRILLRGVVQEVIDSQKDKLHASLLHVSNDVPAGLPQMAANEQQLQRFLTLFLECALAELPSGSKIEWTAEEQHSRCHGDSILLEIVDDGNGLSDRHLGLPFRAFDSEDAAPHLALNQLICYMIAYYHDAKIAISENSEGGVTIGIRLPLKPQPRETGGDAFFDLFVPES